MHRVTSQENAPVPARPARKSLPLERGCTGRARGRLALLSQINALALVAAAHLLPLFTDAPKAESVVMAQLSGCGFPKCFHAVLM